MAPKYKIALIQLHPKPLQIEDNFIKASSFITRAASSGAHLAVLPEYHLTGWQPQDAKFLEQCKRSGDYLARYRDLARELKICIVPGTIVEPFHDDAGDMNDGSEQGEEGEGKESEARLMNVAYFIGDDGSILGRYEKKNLWHPERDHLTSSRHDPHQAFDTPLGKVGLLICWDLAFPEAFRELIAQDARMIIIPTFWTLADCTPYGLRVNPLSEKLFLESMLTARAYENTAAIVFVNAGGRKGGTREGSYAGLSRVAMPFQGALGTETMDSVEEGMSIVDVDMEILDEAEKNYKVREDMKRDDWHYTYRHDDFGKAGKL